MALQQVLLVSYAVKQHAGVGTGVKHHLQLLVCIGDIYYIQNAHEKKFPIKASTVNVSELRLDSTQVDIIILASQLTKNIIMHPTYRSCWI